MRSPERAIPLAIVIALLLTGCGKHYWNKPGTDRNDFARDSSECARENALYMSGTKDYGIVLEDRYKRACEGAAGCARSIRNRRRGGFETSRATIP